jgi:4a-hydroxytetrahydrobiopterin dehydratase
MARSSDQEIQEFLDANPGWSREADSITRTFQFEDFVGSIGFVAEVALLAEKANHHPDIDIRWNKVTLVLSTHSEGGITSKDLDLAMRSNNLG